MEVIYEQTAQFNAKMKSGLMKEKCSAIHIKGKNIDSLIVALNDSFKTNLNVEGQKFDDCDILIWRNDYDDNSDCFQITVNDKYSSAENHAIVKRIIEIMNTQAKNVQWVRISRNCAVDPLLVEQFLMTLQDGDVFENILEKISKFGLIDSGILHSNERSAQMIDEFESILFAGIVNKKIRVNGKEGILKEVNGNWGRYGFFETGVKKNYAGLSLGQKMGTRTIRELEIIR